MPEDALIGHTGFVGGALAASGWPFAARFNSSNIQEMRGRRFGTVVCAGVSAVKWLANREPEADWRGIASLLDVLSTVRAERFVLVSTIDVYPVPLDVTEADVPPLGNGQPYGRHRLQIEHAVRERFACNHIVRLPALFGDGLRKNALFDLLTNHMTQQINPEGHFQWYPLRRFADDLRRIIAAELALVNIAVQPLRMGDIAARFFPSLEIGPAGGPGPRYNVRSLHAALLGGAAGYHLTGDQALEEIGHYVAVVRARGGLP
jgi:nucleoside-diphosphate-sugar epimerase